MSRQLINEYRADLDRLRTVSGSRREGVLSDAFKDLLRRWGKSNELVFVSQHAIVTKAGNRIYTDGALLHSLRVPFGYWEAKDEDDDLEREIEAKFRKGYPKDNIIFSDDRVAILYQDGTRAGEAAMDDTDALLPLLTRFFAHERAEVADFRKAVKQFAIDLPQVLAALRDIIAEKRASTREFARAEDAFLKHARDAINPAVSEEDVQEMLIQHILTEDIFAKVFENPDFHRQNNVAAALYALEEKLFGYGEKQKLLKALGPYYAGIQSTAAVIQSHSEKQGFLKGLYENFYKVYNPLAADRLGVVYTPGEIVRFMIRSADWLCEKHFGKNLIDRGVEILDPATGTGTFIVELLEHFRGNRDKLAHKYKEELHANEVAILPYYVANLNIEATYAAITGQFAEYPNLCFVDTLDNVAALGIYSGHQGDMFGSVSDENMGRIKRQNERKISVIIGNPPYNANQQNENDNNKNRTYARVDERIKQTYIKASTAQKTKLYDMYARFYRWASDRLDKKDGIVAFITNRSFIDSKTFDGFRKRLAEDFTEVWIVDLGGGYKDAGVAGKSNVFGIGTGVAIAFLVKKDGQPLNLLNRVAAPDRPAHDKLSWLSTNSLSSMEFRSVKPSPAGSWDEIKSSFPSTWLSIAFKGENTEAASGAVFAGSSNGVVTARDDWAYDRSKTDLLKKVGWFVQFFESERTRWGVEKPRGRFGDWVGRAIKWTSELERSLVTGKKIRLHSDGVARVMFRPFTKRFMYYEENVTHRIYQNKRYFPLRKSDENRLIAFTGPDSQKPFLSLASSRMIDYHLVGGGATSVELPRYRYNKSGERIDNITDWAVVQFEAHYGTPSPLEGEGGAALAAEGEGPAASAADRNPARTNKRLSAADAAGPSPDASRHPLPQGEREWKDAIFAYCYAVLHDPLYRDKYALNLKREFPRLPFYFDFAQWVAWGDQLLELHIDYENAKPFKLTRVDTPNRTRAKGTHPKPKLKSDPDDGVVMIDEDTQLTGIPRAAWTYRLGNRSAIDWVLDQHKEKTPRDPTVRAKFNTYRFADHKEAMIDLLAKVVAVSLETVKITEAMRAIGGARRA